MQEASGLVSHEEDGDGRTAVMTASLPRARRIALTGAQLSKLRSSESALLLTVAERDLADSALCTRLRQWIKDIKDPKGQFRQRIQALARALLERHVLYTRVKSMRMRRTSFRGSCLTALLMLLAVLLQHGAAVAAMAAFVAYTSGAGARGGDAGGASACTGAWSYLAPRCYVRVAAQATLHWGAVASATALCYLLLSAAGSQLQAVTRLRHHAAQMRVVENALLSHFEEAAVQALVEFAGPRLADVYDALLNLPPEQRAWITLTYSDAEAGAGGGGEQQRSFKALRDLLFLRLEAFLVGSDDVVTLLGKRFDGTLVDDLTQRAAEDYYAAVREYTRSTDRLGEAQVESLRASLHSGLMGAVSVPARLARGAVSGGLL